MFDLVPLARPWWKMANCYHYSDFVRQFLQKEFPRLVSAAVTSAAISTDEQIFEFNIMVFSA